MLSSRILFLHATLLLGALGNASALPALRPQTKMAAAGVRSGRRSGTLSSPEEQQAALFRRLMMENHHPKEQQQREMQLESCDDYSFGIDCLFEASYTTEVSVCQVEQKRCTCSTLVLDLSFASSLVPLSLVPVCHPYTPFLPL